MTDSERNMIKRLVEDYTVAVVNPHLKGLVRDVSSSLFESTGRITVRVKLDPEDHQVATDQSPDQESLSVLTEKIVDSLTRDRFGLESVLRFLSTAG